MTEATGSTEPVEPTDQQRPARPAAPEPPSERSGPIATASTPAAAASPPSRPAPREEAAPEVRPQDTTRRSGVTGRLPLVAELLTAATAVAALVLSLSNSRQLNQEAQLVVELPDVLRLTQHTDGATLTLQPQIMVERRTDVTSIVSDIELRVTADGGPAGAFRWVDVSAYTHDPADNVPNWAYLADPAPIVVVQEEPYAQHLRFVTDALPPAGRWSVELTAERLQGESLVRHFCVVLSQQELASIVEGPPSTPVVLRNDYLETSPRSEPDRDCYRPRPPAPATAPPPAPAAAPAPTPTGAGA